MSLLPPWNELVEGNGCPLCELRDQHTHSLYFICPLSASYLYLNKNQVYGGACVLIYRLGHATRPSELSADEWQAFSSDIRQAEKAVSATLQPDHMNIEMLGNSVPHLHAYLFPRVKSDPQWGHPIWMKDRASMPRLLLEDNAYAALAKDIYTVIRDA